MAYEDGAMASPGQAHEASGAAQREGGDAARDGDAASHARWPGERPSDLVGDQLPTYRARELAPRMRRDSGLYDSGLTGRYPGLRGSGTRDRRITSTGPGPGAGNDQQPDQASMLAGRTALVATIVVGQLWALTAALDSYNEQRTDQVWMLLAFEALSFALAIAVWLATARGR